MAYKTRIADDAVRYPGRMESKFIGTCKQCGETYHPGDRVNWNPRVKGTACHASCYAVYGSPVGAQYQPTPRSFIPKGNTPVVPVVDVDVPEVTPKADVPEVNVASKSGNTLGEQLAEAVAPYLNDRLRGLVTTQQVESIVQRLFDGMIFKSVHTVTVNDAKSNETKDMGIQHFQFPTLLKAMQARTADGYRLNIWLVGPAGTGKTTAAKKCAEALGLDFYFTGSIDTEYKLLGFVDAQGRCIKTAFRKAYTEGGVFLFDECDSSLPPALLAFNAALANGECAFPDGVLDRHKDFVCIAAANTWGLGATSDYVGRLKADAAFLDRFAQLEWAVDESLELATVGNDAWVKKVQSWRRQAREKGIKVVISPRASYFGASLLATGMDEKQVVAMTVRKALTEDQWNSINRGY